MDIIVCIKQVPDTELVPRLSSDKKDIDRRDINYCINPYDEYAIEEAVKIKEALGPDKVKVTLVSIGLEGARESLLKGLAFGADEAILVTDPTFSNLDTLLTAKLLHKIISGLKFDLILTGKQAIDDDACEAPAMLAQLLNIPQVTIIKKLTLNNDLKSCVCEREIENFTEIVEVNLPFLATAQKGLNTPRYLTLPNIMKARQKPIKVLALNNLSDFKLDAPKTEILELNLFQKARNVKVFEGELAEIIPKALKLLKEEAKVI